MSDSQTTTDHDTTRTWAEARQGHPAAVKAIYSGHTGHTGRTGSASRGGRV